MQSLMFEIFTASGIWTLGVGERSLEWGEKLNDGLALLGLGKKITLFSLT